MDAPRFKGANVPLHVAAARLRPSAAVAAADGDWDAVIARAKMQVASQKTPPPTPRRQSSQALRGRAPGHANATLDAFMRRSRATQNR